ncbi:MAG: hypothetical protein H0T92_08895 [Pyrinomonadaceae bacterium]|nr:hypothetical protein [Pyrinomonadaceae bacterium]
MNAEIELLTELSGRTVRWEEWRRGRAALVQALEVLSMRKQLPYQFL